MRSPLRIAILETGLLQPRMQEKYGGFGKLYTKILVQAADSLDPDPPGFSSNELQITCWDVVGPEAEYPDLADVDAVLISGSSMLCPRSICHNRIFS